MVVFRDADIQKVALSGEAGKRVLPDEGLEIVFFDGKFFGELFFAKAGNIKDIHACVDEPLSQHLFFAKAGNPSGGIEFDRTIAIRVGPKTPKPQNPKTPYVWIKN